MARRKKMTRGEPFPHNDAITQSDTYDFKGTLLERDREIRIKNLRGTYLFHSYANNADLGKDWVTVMSKAGGSFHSFRPDQIKEIVKPPKVRRARKRTVSG